MLRAPVYFMSSMPFYEIIRCRAFGKRDDILMPALRRFDVSMQEMKTDAK